MYELIKPAAYCHVEVNNSKFALTTSMYNSFASILLTPVLVKVMKNHQFFMFRQSVNSFKR